MEERKNYGDIKKEIGREKELQKCEICGEEVEETTPVELSISCKLGLFKEKEELPIYPERDIAIGKIQVCKSCYLNLKNDKIIKDKVYLDKNILKNIINKHLLIESLNQKEKNRTKVGKCPICGKTRILHNVKNGKRFICEFCLQQKI